MICLGIETSCDETSIALLDSERVLASQTYTQEVHAHFGGVVPEAASRQHLVKIDPLCRMVFDTTGLRPGDVDLLAVTDRPGLAGALLVGVSFALGLHSSYATPITGINHLEGHISAILLEHPHLGYPFVALVVSGGHTALYRVDDFGVYACIGQTVDDAAGEAFDKIGKMLGFPYPAGRLIEQEANQATDEQAAAFRFPQARLAGYDFSFSGLKTSVRNFLSGKSSDFLAENRRAICRGFQKAVIDALVSTTRRALTDTGIGRLALVGGVACNQTLRNALSRDCGAQVLYPSPKYCTDNAAMIARAGLERARRNLLRPVRMDPAGRL